MLNNKKNIYSQNGEDGILDYLLSIIPDKNNWCCEFGAWDGKYLSNTFNLVENKNYNAVYIESDETRYNDLLKTADIYKQIIPINKFIDIEKNLIDNILIETKIPLNFDVLSIDVDGVDYALWKSIKKYKPKIVVIEINSSINPNTIFYENELSIEYLSNRPGVNFMTCYNLGIEKGYTFLCHTGNMIFIDSMYNNLFKTIPNNENLIDYFDKTWV
jgi:hypothetical protein